MDSNHSHIKQIVIIAGGIAGLATAYILQKRARVEELPIAHALLESSPYPGSKIVTDREECFVIAPFLFYQSHSIPFNSPNHSTLFSTASGKHSLQPVPEIEGYQDGTSRHLKNAFELLPLI